MYDKLFFVINFGQSQH